MLAASLVAILVSVAAVLRVAHQPRPREPQAGAGPAPPRPAGPDQPDAQTPPLTADNSMFRGICPGYSPWAEESQDLITVLKTVDRILVKRGRGLPPLPRRSPLPRGWDGWNDKIEPLSEGRLTPLNVADPALLVLPPEEPQVPPERPPDLESPTVLT